MSEDRSWMYRRVVDGVVSSEFKKGVTMFIQFAEENSVKAVDCRGRIRCPCLVCKNFKWLTIWDVQTHLYRKGFVEDYTNWTSHGEAFLPNRPTNVEGRSSYVDMVLDVAGSEFNVHEKPVYTEEMPNTTAARFYQLLKDAEEPLWKDCKNHTRLSFVSQLLNLKSECHFSESCFDRLIIFIKSLLPEDAKLPDNFYRAKKMVNELGLGYVKIDSCPNHCMLYYKENEDKISCSICHQPRYKPNRGKNTTQKNVPHSSLWYFPITPRLQRLHMSSKTAQYMRWHAERVLHDEKIISHPADGEAWIHFNHVHPTFSMDARNVRLGLCTDGFNPFGGSVASYSSWPVFVTPYSFRLPSPPPPQPASLQTAGTPSPPPPPPPPPPLQTDMDDQTSLHEGAGSTSDVAPRSVWINDGDKIEPSTASKFITRSFKAHFPGPFHKFSDVPMDVQSALFDRFMSFYTFTDSSHEAKARTAWTNTAKENYKNMLYNTRRKISQEIGTMDTLQWKEHVSEYIKREDWVALCDIWAGERWVETSAKMKVNRATHPEENVHTVGSVSFATQKARLFQRPPNFEEVFDHCHKRKGTGDYVSDRAQQIAESYQKGMEEKYGEQDQRPQLDPEIWVEATGPPKKGKVYGFGHSLGGSTVLASTLTAVSHATSPFSTPTHSAPSTVNPEQMAQQITESLSQQLTQSLSQQLAQTVTQIQSQMSQMQSQMQSQMSQMFGQMQQQMSQHMSQYFSQLGVHPLGAPPTQQHQDHMDVGGDGQDDATNLG